VTFPLSHALWLPLFFTGIEITATSPGCIADREAATAVVPFSLYAIAPDVVILSVPVLIVLSELVTVSLKNAIIPATLSAIANKTKSTMKSSLRLFLFFMLVSTIIPPISKMINTKIFILFNYIPICIKMQLVKKKKKKVICIYCLNIATLIFNEKKRKFC
jgi:hypothetical protein